MRKLAVVVAASLVCSLGFAKIETYDNPKNVSEACVSKILSAVEKHSSLEQYVPEKAHASLEWYDDDEREMYVTVTDPADSYAGYLTARFEVKKLGRGQCSVGKLVTWDFAS